MENFDIETIAVIIATAITICSMLVPVLYKVAELTNTKVDDNAVTLFEKGLKLAIDISEAVGINKIAKRQEQKKKEKEIKKEQELKDSNTQ